MAGELVTLDVVKQRFEEMLRLKWLLRDLFKEAGLTKADDAYNATGIDLIAHYIGGLPVRYPREIENNKKRIITSLCNAGLGDGRIPALEQALNNLRDHFALMQSENITIWPEGIPFEKPGARSVPVEPRLRSTASATASATAAPTTATPPLPVAVFASPVYASPSAAQQPPVTEAISLEIPQISKQEALEQIAGHKKTIIALVKEAGFITDLKQTDIPALARATGLTLPYLNALFRPRSPAPNLGNKLFDIYRNEIIKVLAREQTPVRGSKSSAMKQLSESQLNEFRGAFDQIKILVEAALLAIKEGRISSAEVLPSAAPTEPPLSRRDDTEEASAVVAIKPADSAAMARSVPAAVSKAPHNVAATALPQKLDVLPKSRLTGVEISPTVRKKQAKPGGKSERVPAADEDSYPGDTKKGDERSSVTRVVLGGSAFDRDSGAESRSKNADLNAICTLVESLRIELDGLKPIKTPAVGEKKAVLYSWRDLGTMRGGDPELAERLFGRFGGKKLLEKRYDPVMDQSVEAVIDAVQHLGFSGSKLEQFSDKCKLLANAMRKGWQLEPGGLPTRPAEIHIDVEELKRNQQAEPVRMV